MEDFWKPKTRLARMLIRPARHGLYHHVMTELAVKQHAMKSLEFMRRTLKELETALGGQGLLWKTLNLKLQKFELFAFTQMERDINRVLSTIPRSEHRKHLVDIFEKLDEFGSQPFWESLVMFSDTCTEIVFTELNKVERFLEMSRRRHDDRVQRLRIKAHDRTQDLWDSIQAPALEEDRNTFKDFWPYVIAAHHAILDLDKATRMTKTSDLKSLETYVGLPLPKPIAVDIPVEEDVAPVRRSRRSFSPNRRRVLGQQLPSDTSKKRRASTEHSQVPASVQSPSKSSRQVGRSSKVKHRSPPSTVRRSEISTQERRSSLPESFRAQGQTREIRASSATRNQEESRVSVSSTYTSSRSSYRGQSQESVTRSDYARRGLTSGTGTVAASEQTSSGTSFDEIKYS